MDKRYGGCWNLDAKESKLRGVWQIQPKIFGDARGYFYEVYRESRFREVGMRTDFVQDSLSCSEKGVLRGLHYQLPQPQGKLVYVVRGSVYDVVVDIRKGSPTFGQWCAFELSDANKTQIFISEGFAHGFYVTSETAILCYKLTDYYRPDCEKAIAWNDPDLGITWPGCSNPSLSAKDVKAVRLCEVGDGDLPAMGPAT